MASYLTPDVSSSVNMYNKETRLTNTCVGANSRGEEVALNGVDISNFILVEPNTQYTVTRGYPAGTGGAQYTSNGTFTSNITKSSDAPYTFTTSASARFVRMNIQRSSTDPETYMMTKASEWPNEYVPFVVASSYNITYVINGHGTQPAAATGTKLPNPLPILTAEGYEFGGWYTDSELTTPAVAGASISADTTLYAKWTQVATYTVTFNSNGGSAVASQSVMSGNLATRPTDPTKTNYVFVDWYSDEELTTIFSFGTAILNDTTLYAKWRSEETPTYTIYFEENGGSTVVDLTNQTEIPSSLPTPTKLNYSFGGWYTDSGLTTQAVVGTTLNANITLYAKWNENQSTGMTTIRASYNSTPLSEFKVANQKVDDENIITDFKGKKVVFFGDSITYWTDCYPKTSGWSSFPLGNDYYLKNYLTLAREKLGLITVNKGASGAKSSSICSSMRSFNLTDAYAVVLTCGTNDYNNNIEPSTYKSNITSALSTVMTNYPKVKIYCMTMPYNTITGKTYNIRDYGDKFEEACLEYNLPLLRIDKTLPINSTNASTFLVDGIHPNNDGHKLLADQFIPFLLNH